MDVLTDVLNTVHLHSAVHFCTELTTPWGIRVPAQNDLAIFYVMTRGSCYLEVDGYKSPVSLAGGDLLMLSHGDAHVLRDRLDSPIVPLEELVKACPKCDGHRSFQHGGGGSLTAMVAGHFIFENQTSKPFLSTLPPLIHIHGEQGQVVPWLDTTLKWMAAETNSKNPGAQIMASRLTDMLFIQILRAHIAEHAGECDGKAGWLRAMADPHLGKAFELIHEQPNHPWTVAELASQVNMSRTAFSMRFAQLAGVPPLAYVTKWRMLKAGDILRQGQATISEVATYVGYESEASFSKAFKREMGVAPGTYRREGQNGAIGVL
ncbi:AraC family transcriptional regulator [candidate division KSB1 bacterium]|nr:AraC family transcriptional regulator [candidate division KSB1 bacterium]